MKTTIILILLGALVGVGVADAVVPPMLSWYSAPGGLPHGAQIQAVVDIPEVIRYATGKLMLWQAIAAAIGGVLGLVAGIVFSSRRRQSVDAVATPKP